MSTDLSTNFYGCEIQLLRKAELDSICKELQERSASQRRLAELSELPATHERHSFLAAGWDAAAAVFDLARSKSLSAREEPLPIYDNQALMCALAAVLRIAYPDCIVAWIQPFGWTTEGHNNSKIPNTAEQHGPDDVAQITGWECIVYLDQIAVFRERSGSEESP